MRRGTSLLGQTISLCCTQTLRFQMTLHYQTNLGSLICLASVPILVPFSVVPSWRCSTVVPED